MTHTTRVDALDARILLAIDEDPDCTTLSLSRSLGVARNTVHARLRRLGQRDVLGAASRRVNLDSLGYGLTAFIEISISQNAADDAFALIESTPEIVEVHSTTGHGDVLAKVVARDTADLHRITNVILQAPGVQRTNTAVSLKEVVPYRLSPLLGRIAAAEE